MSARQIGINAAGAIWLAEVLDRWGLAESTERAEWVVAQLVEQGVAPVPASPPLRGPGADADHRKAAKAEIDKALEAARARRIADEGFGGGS